VTGYDDPAFFGDRWAYLYDEGLFEAPAMENGPTVDFLADLAGAPAGGGRVLELAIGTGRIGLPLAARGLAVEGVEASAAMVDRLRAKPGGDNLTSSQRQEDTFRNVARVLEPGGAFVIECFVPNPAAFTQGQRVSVLNVSEDAATIELAGLRLTERYADWGRAPFGADSRGHVSVYRPA